MTNVYASPTKLSMRNFLFKVAEEALERAGWTVERIPRSGKASLRRITKGKLSKTVSIRTSQDTWIAFPRTPDGKAWATLGEVDYVVAASVDSYSNPQYAQVHMVGGDEIRSRFDRAYEARKSAGHRLPAGRGVWVSMYDPELPDVVASVGGGIGLAHPPIARVSLAGQDIDLTPSDPERQVTKPTLDEAPLTIAEAKRRLAKSFGVAEADITITISS
jgi:hypothetical protein